MKTLVFLLLTITAITSARSTSSDAASSTTGLRLLHRIIRESGSKAADAIKGKKMNLFILKEILAAAKDLNQTLTANVRFKCFILPVAS